MIFRWTDIEKDPVGITSRAKVPGGWLVKYYVFEGYESNGRGQATMVFIADEDHKWRVD